MRGFQRYVAVDP